MRQFACLLALALLLTLAGCGKKETGGAASQPQTGPEAAAPEDAVPVEPLALEHLSVEVSRGAEASSELLRAVKELPALLQSALNRGSVTVEEVTVTVSGGTEATAEALLRGGVDVAVIPASELAALEQEMQLALVSGPVTADENGAAAVGQQMLLCAADTAYGRNLAARKAPTWAELDRARWGVVAGDRLGHNAVELWLADHYEGNTLSDLSTVTFYDSWDALADAAERGKVDVFPAAADGGTDRPILGRTERLYDMVVAVSEEAADPRLAAALLTALEELRQGPYGALFGTEPYGLAPPEALMAQRRMAFLTG